MHDHVPATAHLKLATIEHFLGAMLAVPLGKLQALRRMEDALQVQVTVVQDDVRATLQKWEPSSRHLADHKLCDAAARFQMQKMPVRCDPTWSAAEVDTWERLANRRRRAVRRLDDSVLALRTLLLRVRITSGMRLLLEEYAPACLFLGTQVRDCHWKLRQPGTGDHARNALQTAFVILLRLCEGQAHKVEYVRSLAVALSLWSPWHSSLPACCFSEEVNEAALSRLGRACRRNPRAVSTTDVNDLYILVQSGRRGYKKLKPGGVTAAWQSQPERHLDVFISNNAADVACVPWVKRADKKCVVAGNWPENVTMPPTLTKVDSTDFVSDVVVHHLATMVQSQPVHVNTVPAFNDTFNRRPSNTVTALEAALDSFSAWEHQPRRFRSKRPPRPSSSAPPRPPPLPQPDTLHRDPEQPQPC